MGISKPIDDVIFDFKHIIRGGKNMSTLDKVVEILVEAKDLEADKITEASTWDDLGLDSLDTVELVMNMEDAFGISLEMTEDMKTVGDVVKAIDAAK